MSDQKEKIFITTKIKKYKNWTREEDQILIDAANKFKQRCWTKVSMFFTNKNPAQCRARYKRIRPGIVKGAWTKQEDELISSYVNTMGKNWALISKLMPTRNGKQIRDRFLNYLDPIINKVKFTDEEDKLIIHQYIQHGSKWSVIAKYFDGRTGDMIKNRFYSCLKRKIHSFEVNSNKRLRKKYYKAKKLNNEKLKNVDNIINNYEKDPNALLTNNTCNEDESNKEKSTGGSNISKDYDSFIAKSLEELNQYNIAALNRIVNLQKDALVSNQRNLPQDNIPLFVFLNSHLINSNNSK